jgi:transposase-like protein
MFTIPGVTMITIKEFQEQFPDDDACFQYLYQKRWADGFKCPRCHHNKAYKLQKRKLMQCKACKYQVSVTAGTIFHRLRQPLSILLWACYWIATTKKGISAMELQRKMGFKSYQTAWTLLHKIRKAMKSSGKYPIGTDVEFDGTFLGLSEKPNDNHRAHVKVVVETDGTHIGRAYLEHVPSQKSVVVKKFIRSYVVSGVVIKTDGHVSYKFLKQLYQHQPHKMYDKKDNNKHLPKVHIIITNLKNWLRGTYNHMPNKHAQLFLNEFCFRFNRRWNLDSIFDKLVHNTLINNTVTYAELTG